MSHRIDRVVTSGIFSLDGEDFDVDNNVWVVGDDSVVVIDPAHDHRPILDVLESRSVSAIVCTHGHNDHINAAGALAEATGAPIYLHPDDRMLWDVVYPDRVPDRDLVDGGTVGPLRVIHTPGHSPGACCLHLQVDGVLFSGDTLFQGGPGATGRSYSSYPTIVDSIARKLLILPAETVVNTGHGLSTTIGHEAPSLDEWKTHL